MENSTISHIGSSTIRQNTHHYLPLMMTNGNKISGTIYSYMGSEPNSVKESNSQASAKDISSDPSSTVSQSKPDANDRGNSQTANAGSNQRKKSSMNIIPDRESTQSTKASTLSTVSQTKSISGESPLDKSSSTSASTSTSSSSKPTVPTADLIDGALSDFEGSELSDISSSSSSASASDHDSGDSEESNTEDNTSDTGKSNDEDEDESMENSSASDDPGPRSIPRRKKNSISKSRSQSSHRRRRIESDSSNGEEEREVIKRKPGRPPKLKSHPARSATISSPTSPVSPMLSAQSKKPTVDTGHQQNSEVQPKKKIKQPDFTNVGKRDRSGRTQLFKFTALGDLETCRKLIEAGAEVNDRDNADWTPLHEACVTGHEKVAELLIQHNADVNARGGHMDTPLHDAAQNGHVEVVKLLLSHGANVVAKNAKGIIPIDVADEKEVIDLLQRRQALVNMLTGKNQAGQTLLHRACSSGSYNNVVELLNQGADINVQDNAQWTPLHEAALEGHTKVVELLLSRGADPNARGHGNDTALHDSAQNEHLDVVRLLLEYGADPDFKNSKGEKACDVTDDDDILHLLKTGDKGTKKPIQHSTGSIISSHHNSQLSKLVSTSNRVSKNDKDSRRKEGSIDVNMSDDGRSASEERPPMSRDERKMQQLLSTIRMQEQMEERRKAKKRLAKRESEDEGDDNDHDPKPTQSRSSNSTSSVWKQPRSNGQTSKTSSGKSTIKNGSKVRSLRSEDRDDSGSEPEKYRQARRSTQRSTGDRHRTDYRSKDSLGRTQLHQGAESGDIQMVGNLLESGVERDPKDHKGLTPLHLAAKAGNTEVLVLLLAYNCNVNAQDNEKTTALHEAVRNHHVEAVRLLLQNNAHPNIRDSHKRTCYDLSVSKDGEIRALLKSSIEQAELKSKERSKKRLSQSIESHGSPKYKERKTSRQSDSDEPVKLKKKDSDRAELEDKKHHSRNSSTSGVLSKSTSMPQITSPPSTSLASTNVSTNSASNWKYSSEDNRDDTSSPSKKQKLLSQRGSASGTGSNAQEGIGDTASSKKRREADRKSDGYGSKFKIKKEREEEIQNPRLSNMSTKLDEIRRVTSLPSFSKDNTNGDGSLGNSNITINPKLSRHASKPSLSSSIKSTPGVISGSSIASISPPLTDTSTSPPPTSVPASLTQDPESHKSRKRSSQIFSSSSGYQKFADELKQGSLGTNSASQHHRQRSTGSVPSRPSATTTPVVHGSTVIKNEEALEVDTATSRKKAKTTPSDSLGVTYGNGKESTRGVVSESLYSPSIATESNKDYVDIKKVKEEVIDDHVPSQRSLQDAGRYLPLYTVQLPGDNSSIEPFNVAPRNGSTSINGTSQHYSVVDRQVQLLLGLPQEALYRRYPYLQRRSINNREKARLWSPLSSMVSDRCAAAVKLNFEALPVECQFSSLTNAATAMSRLKEHEKQKFLSCDLYFIQLEDVLDLIRRDYPHLNDSMVTITVDIDDDDEIENGMDVEAASITVKSEEVDDMKPKVVLNQDLFKGITPSVNDQPSSNGHSASSTPNHTPITPSGHMHRLMRVPAKMATKAMFKKEMQFQST